MNKKIAVYYALLMTLVAVQVGANIFDNSVLAFYNQKVSTLSQERQALSKEYKQAQQILATQNSLHTLEKQATAQGYTPITKTLSLTQSNAVALSQQ